MNTAPGPEEESNEDIITERIKKLIAFLEILLEGLEGERNNVLGPGRIGSILSR